MVLLFGFQAGTIVAQPLVIAMIAVPLVLQSYGIFAISWVGAKLLQLPHDIAGPACLIGTSNFFELAVAVAISLFGLNSGAALATVVGVLVEVPVMLSLVLAGQPQRGGAGAGTGLIDGRLQHQDEYERPGPRRGSAGPGPNAGLGLVLLPAGDACRADGA